MDDGGVDELDAGAITEPDGTLDVLAPAFLFKSGARLQARVFAGEDVEASFVTWFDTLLGSECDFRESEGGVLRCLPPAAGDLLFRDPSCTSGTLVRAYGAPPPAGGLVSVERRRSCGYRNGSEFATVRLGTAANPRVFYGLTDDGRCIREPSPHRAGATSLHEATLATSSELERWVAAAVVLQQAGGRVGRTVIVAADGAAQARALHDLDRDVPCRVVRGTDGELRCAPGPLLYGFEDGAFADAECSVPTLYHFGGCEAAEFGGVEHTDPATCDPYVRVYSRGDGPLPPGDIHSVSFEGECRVPDSASRGYYVRGTEVPPEALPRLAHHLSGGNRVRVYKAASPGSGFTVRFAPNHTMLVAPPDEYLYDTANDAPCEPARFEDGTWRCQPANATVAREIRHYLDAECTEPAHRISPGACAPKRFVALVTAFDPVERAVSELYRVNLIGPDFPLFERTDDECSPAEGRGRPLVQAEDNAWQELVRELE